MRPLQKAAASILCAIFVLMLLATFLLPAPYARQFRDIPNAGPSTAHPLGTDALGRDSISRLLYGTRVSLLLAPAAALLSTLIAALLGSIAGLLGGWFERIVLAATDLSLALPWLFLLLVVRAMLPLDVPPLVSVVIAFLMMGLLGWQASVRVICAAARGVRDSDFLLLARSSGCKPARLLLRHIAPNLRPLFYAQFFISIPLFILTEANLSILGLGVMEPMPSWGNLMRGFEDFSTLSANPWRLVPLILLVIVVICFQLVLPSQEVTQ
jgi:peptide/nickel transport system permease protein